MREKNFQTVDFVQTLTILEEPLADKRMCENINVQFVLDINYDSNDNFNHDLSRV